MQDGGLSAISADEPVVGASGVKRPESNGMAEAFVNTFKRDYVQFSDPDAKAVFRELSKWFEDYNKNHPHKGLKMLSPREFRRTDSGASPCPVSEGQLQHVCRQLKAYRLRLKEFFS